eukprot:GHVN01024749.1.p1 GENE.GHVN01024749.1~~GHVN01024749.1.p1  ORF type:complete len:329 (-),score=14.64 GHVN01024749.1:232-1218(-)
MLGLGYLYGLGGGLGYEMPIVADDNQVTKDRGMWFTVMAGFPVLAAVLQFIFFTIIPFESPLWLVSKRMPELALQMLKKIYPNEIAHQELNQIVIENHSQQLVCMRGVGVEQFWSSPKYRAGLGKGIFIVVAEQLTGFNAILNQPNRLFGDAHMKPQWQTKASLVLGVVVVLASTLSGKSNRYANANGVRRSLMFGAVGEFIGVLMCTVSFNTGRIPYRGVVCLLGATVFVVSQRLGFGSLSLMYFKQTTTPELQLRAETFGRALGWGATLGVGYGVSRCGWAKSGWVLCAMIALVFLGLFAVSEPTAEHQAILGSEAPNKSPIKDSV